jgi:hypothetical protein
MMNRTGAPARAGGVVTDPQARALPSASATQPYRVPGTRPRSSPPFAAMVRPSGAVARMRTRSSPSVRHESVALVPDTASTHGPRVNGSGSVGSTKRSQ